MRILTAQGEAMQPQGDEIDALLLDVDGTLWDSTPIVAKAWTRAVRETGYKDMEVKADTLKGLFGRTMDEIALALLPEASLDERTRLMDKCVIYEQEALEADPCDICYPKVLETIRELADDVFIAIVSNCQSGYIELFMRKTGLTSVQISDKECFGDTGCGKAENIRAVVERNGLRYPYYVGDTEGDRAASREAGVGFIAADYGFGEPKEADCRLRSFDELRKIIIQDSKYGKKN